MKYLATESQRKSFTITTILFVILFFLFLYFKMASSDAELLELGGGGVAVNFGDSEFGSGDNYESLNLSQLETQGSILEQSLTDDDVIIQESDDAPVIASVKKTEKKEKKTVEKLVVIKEIPKPSKSTSDALSSILNGSKSKGGDGGDKVGGNKGKIEGDANATGYNGEDGIGSGSGSGYGNGSGYGSGYGNYQLGGRNALSKPQPKYDCNEQGIVVVQISVDRYGKVTSAESGVRGTTNLAKCLLDQAKIAAMNTKWQADNNAPEKQVGKIIYNFKLTE